MTDRHSQAQALSNQPYAVKVSQDESSPGQPIFLAENIELVGCMAQGDTIKDAIAELEDARIAYIESLLEDGLEIPQPILMQTTSLQPADISEDVYSQEGTQTDFLGHFPQDEQNQTMKIGYLIESGI